VNTLKIYLCACIDMSWSDINLYWPTSNLNLQATPTLLLTPLKQPQTDETVFLTCAVFFQTLPLIIFCKTQHSIRNTWCSYILPSRPYIQICGVMSSNDVIFQIPLRLLRKLLSCGCSLTVWKTGTKVSGESVA
jgi:hypothetical protein